jgi:hypothetical protein
LTAPPITGVVTPAGRVAGGHWVAQYPAHVERPEAWSGTKRYKVSPYPSTRTVPRPFTDPDVTM